MLLNIKASNFSSSSKLDVLLSLLIYLKFSKIVLLIVDSSVRGLVLP